MTTLRALAAAAALIVCASTTATAQSPGASGSEVPAASTSTAVGAYRPGSLSIMLEPFAEGLDSPVFVTHDGTGSGVLFAVERGGTIRAIEPDGTVAETPLLDISENVRGGGEQGLLGLAFHPAYARNDRLFVYYTRLSDSAQVVSEFQTTDGVADAASERVILEMPDEFSNHNGGMLLFDPEGFLLIGTGDGGGGGDPLGSGQDDTSLLGKLLRIDVDGEQPYAVPVNDPDGRLDEGARPEIRATGLRNPWRFSIDPATGHLFIGDVGQNAWEEIDVLPAGQGGLDYGWNVMEGPDCFNLPDCPQEGFTAPVYTYDRGEGCTVIGGYVYRGSAFPDLTGAYIFGDYCSDGIWLLSAVDATDEGTATAELVGQMGGPLASFGEGADGELYAVDLEGRILRVIAVPS